MRISLLALALSLASVSSANLAYLSPSTNHPQYSIPGDHSPPTLQRRALDTQHKPITFTHGVASGDPYADSVILWARAVPSGVDSEEHKYKKHSPAACVAWEISSDSEFKRIADSGRTSTSGEVDYTVKVEATGLEPWRYYWYRFKDCSSNTIISDVGRTKTLPAETDEMRNSTLRLAIYSCSNYVEGHFNAYGMSARRDSVDYVLHLGDYIYETPFPTNLPSRIPRPLKETISLRDYRQRLAIHRTDPDLLLSHKTFPWIAVWDDHEIANNGWREGSGASLMRVLESTTWDSRMEAGLRAYWEWMPLRRVAAAPSSLRIWRSFRIGKMADLAMLDTRYWNRDRTDVPDQALDQDRSIMGADQEEWLSDVLKTSAARNATWMLLGQQVQFSDINETAIPGATEKYWDGWSGYQSNRARILAALERYKVANPVVLTGDYHALWTADLTRPGLKGYNHTTGAGALGVELAGTAVTSSSGYGVLSYEESTDVSRRLVRENAFLKWAEGYYRGYFEIRMTREMLTAEYYAVPDVATRNEQERMVASWEVVEGERRLRRPLPKVEEGATQGVVEEWALKERDIKFD